LFQEQHYIPRARARARSKGMAKEKTAAADIKPHARARDTPVSAGCCADKTRVRRKLKISAVRASPGCSAFAVFRVNAGRHANQAAFVQTLFLRTRDSG